ncbi:MAG: TIGR03084 family metal-binding protein [Marinibacterium sp.]|nr:TIGR03084 family metal-binding protein [Marinibacterium sp.]
MQQAADFLEESDVLAAALEGLAPDDWARATQFKGWTINDVIVHLHFWNRAADLSLRDPEQFQADMAPIMAEMAQSGLRGIENAAISLRGRDLFAAWQGLYRDMGARWQSVDPKTRLAWIGPGMSARSSMTARQMETWAHGMEIFDLLGLPRRDSDRVRNIVVLGINAFGWSHKVQGMALPDRMPYLRLIAPSGAIWDFGDPSDSSRIDGPALDFAAVVTQTRHVDDTDLVTTGAEARAWMERAQCFAGPPETPPAKGTRFVQGGS